MRQPRDLEYQQSGLGAQHKAARVNQQMAFTATDTLSTIIPARATNTGCFNRLTITNCSTRLLVPSSLLPKV
jgi:hypothetical protein